MIVFNAEFLSFTVNESKARLSYVSSRDGHCKHEWHKTSGSTNPHMMIPRLLQYILSSLHQWLRWAPRFQLRPSSHKKTCPWNQNHVDRFFISNSGKTFLEKKRQPHFPGEGYSTKRNIGICTGLTESVRPYSFEIVHISTVAHPPGWPLFHLQRETISLACRCTHM